METETIEVERAVLVEIDAELLEPVAGPSVPADGSTNDELEIYATDATIALGEANARLEKISAMQRERIGKGEPSG